MVELPSGHERAAPHVADGASLDHPSYPPVLAPDEKRATVIACVYMYPSERAVTGPTHVVGLGLDRHGDLVTTAMSDFGNTTVVSVVPIP